MKKNFSKKTTYITFIIVAFQFAGCSSRQLNELENNRQLWEKSRLNNYSFVGNIDRCGAVVMQIQDSKPISTEQVFKSQVGGKLDCYEKFGAVDKIFDYIQQKMKDRKPLYVKYNEKFGYPEEIKIGSSFDEENRINMGFTDVEPIE